MSAALDLFAAHRHIVLARIGFQETLGSLLGESPFPTEKATFVRAVLSSARESSRLSHEAICVVERNSTGKVVHLDSRRRWGR